METLQESPIPHQPSTPEQLDYQLQHKFVQSTLSPIAPSISQLSQDTPMSPQSDVPANVDFAHKIALAREVGQNLCDAALSDLHSSFSSVLSSTTPKSAPAGALWPTGDPLLNLKSTTRVTHPEKKSSQQRWDDLLNHHVFNEPDEYNYVGTNYPDR